MVSLRGAVDNDVITQVLYARDALESLSDCILKHFCSL